MSNDVKAMDTINTTIFTTVASAAVGNVDLSGVSDACYTGRSDNSIGTPKANVDSTATALQQTFFSLGVLWPRCPCRLDVTGGCTNVRTFFDDLKSLFLNVPSNRVHPLP